MVGGLALENAAGDGHDDASGGAAGCGSPGTPLALGTEPGADGPGVLPGAPGVIGAAGLEGAGAAGGTTGLREPGSGETGVVDSGLRRGTTICARSGR